MTFVEAAIEVLKREGKPLPARKLAELAMKADLLSVVGRDPEGTMISRIEDALEKHATLIKVKDGVYGLRDYPPQPYPVIAEKPAKAPRAEKAAADGEAAAATESAAAEGAEAEGADAEGAAEGAAGEKKGRRRRGRRGRGKRGDAAAKPNGAGEGEAVEADAAEGDEAAAEPAAPAPARAKRATAAEKAAAESGAVTEAEAGEAAEGAAVEAAEGIEGEATEGGEKRGRRRSRRGGRGRRREPAAGSEAAAGEAAGDGEASEPPVAPEHEAERAARAADTVATTAEARGGDMSSDLAPGAGGDELLMEGDGPDAEGGEEHEFDLPSGPLMAPTGAEEGSRGDEERVMRAEIPGQRDRERSERGRHRRERGGRGRERGGREGRPESGAQRDARPDRGGGPQGGQREAERGDRPGQQPGGGRPQHDQPRGDQPREGGGPRGIIEAVLDILRSSDGRPMHVRALADQAINRKLLNAGGGHVEVVRQLRAALVHEARDREADGLRARVRALGGGHYGLADRKLDQELVPLERDLGDRSARLRDATRTAVRRRIQRLSPPAFEALGRILLEKLGLTAVELVRRGEGVAYYGGTKRLGVASVRTLVAMRPGDVEISRRAVGELRAGLQAKGFDEGLLLAAARPSQEALAELKAGKGVVVHDGLSLAGMCLKHSLGVRRVHMPIDYLDLEFFQELTDA